MADRRRSRARLRGPADRDPRRRGRGAADDGGGEVRV